MVTSAEAVVELSRAFGIRVELRRAEEIAREVDMLVGIVAAAAPNVPFDLGPEDFRNALLMLAAKHASSS